MYRQFLTIGMVCLMVVLVLMVPKGAEAQDKITGPWLWMIAPTEAGQGGAASTDIDSLAVASGGTVTEADVAANGANIGDSVGDYAWTLSTIRNSGITNTGCCQGSEIDNVTDVLLRLGWAEGDVNHHSSYALITLESATVQNNVRMKVGSDDSIKVWLNGEVVHRNASNRGASDFQDDFQVNLVAGDNLLLIKVSEGTGNWSMFVGIEADVNAVYKPPANGGLRFSPNVIADQTFTAGTYASLTLPEATGGTAPYTYSCTALPAGLQFDETQRQISGTLTTAVNTHPVTYTATDATDASAALTFSITVQETPSLTDKYVYLAIWSQAGSGEIRRINLDGTNLHTLVPGLYQARDVALDIVGNKMYWVDAGTRKVQRANLDGTTLEDLVNTQGRPFGIALDITSNKMYWSTWNPGKIRRANLDGSNVEDFVTGLGEPEDIDLDLSAGKVYWTDTATNKIQRANLDGSNVEDLVTVGLSHPLGMALDVAGGKMYWTNTSYWPGPWPGLDKIQRANLDGSNMEDLVTTGVVIAHGIALDVSAGKMYWTNSGGIQRANLDGSNVEYAIEGVSGTGMALSIPQASGGLRFDPNIIADQTFTVGTSASLTLPEATGGTAPYTYTLTSDLPAGLLFDALNKSVSGIPIAPMPATPYTYTATDATGAFATLTFTITVTGAGANTLDVNSDGQVNILDLVLVAVFYGTRGDGLPADVNADGVVNVLDFAAVAEGVDAAGGLPLQAVEAALLAAAAQAGDIEAIAGAPIAFSTHQYTWSRQVVYRNVSAALADVRHLAAGDARLGRGVALLSELLQLLKEMNAIPEMTALLPNYPNPFNPETWIPYHLATEANVTLTIYNVRGVAIRTLTLGHQPAGVYERRGRAAFWDGRNQLGEPVASGLYFYTLTAGEFNATRKLLIAK